MRNLPIPKEAAKRAAFLAIIPGMGAIYNGQYIKAVTCLVTFFSLAFAGDQIHPVFGWAAFSFYVFMIFDAYRSAEENQRLRMTKEGSETPGPVDVTSPVWGILLILLGLFLTLFNFDIITPAAFRKLWPLIVIIIGLFLIYRAMSSEKSRADDSKTKTQEERKA